MVSIRHVEIELHIRARRPKRTECARSSRIRVGEVAACKGDVRIHVLVGAAAHPRGWFDIATVPFVDLFGVERVVETTSQNIVVVSAMVGGSFKKVLASRTRTTQDDCVKAGFRVSHRQDETGE